MDNFEDYTRVERALNTKIHSNPLHKEELRVALVELCQKYNIPCRETDVISILKAKLRKLLK